MDKYSLPPRYIVYHPYKGVSILVKLVVFTYVCSWTLVGRGNK